MQGAGSAGDDATSEAGETGGSGACRANVAASASAAAMPDWMTYDNGYPYCMLCGKYATEDHLASYPHTQRLASHNYWAPMIAAAGGGQPPGGGTTDDHVTAQLLSGVLPAASGDPRCYRWEGDGFHCRLCWKNVTVGHLNSIGHRRRMQEAPRILLHDHEVGHLFRAQYGGQVTWPGVLPAVASPPAMMAGALVVASPLAPVVASPPAPVVASPLLAIGWDGQVPGGPPLPPPPPPSSAPLEAVLESPPSPPSSSELESVLECLSSPPSSSDSERTIMPPGAAPASPPAWMREVRWRLVQPTSGPIFFHCDDTGESRWELSDERWEADF